jgi:hypothetical protein
MQTGQGDLHWGRYQIDGLPYRGSAEPMTNEEFDQKVGIAKDYFVKTFKLWDEAELAEYQKVMDGAANGVYEIYDRDRQHLGEGRYVVHLEWAFSCLQGPKGGR